VDLADGRIKVKNWFDFTNPKDLAQGTWEVKAAGRTVASGKLPALDIAPHEEKEFALPMPKIDAQPGGEYWLNISFALKHEAATIGGKGFSVRFDKKAGVLTEYRYQGVTVLERGPVPDFWRAPPNNDRGAWKVFRAQAATNKSLDIELWREAGPRWDVKEVTVEKVDGSTAKVAVRAGLPLAGAAYVMRYTIHGDGTVQVECSYKPGAEKLSMMPRFGTELVVAPG